MKIYLSPTVKIIRIDVENFISNSKIEIDHNAQITDAVNGNATQGQNQNPIWGE